MNGKKRTAIQRCSPRGRASKRLIGREAVCDRKDRGDDLVQPGQAAATTVMTPPSAPGRTGTSSGKACRQPVYKLRAAVFTPTCRPMPTAGTAALRHRMSLPSTPRRRGPRLRGHEVRSVRHRLAGTVGRQEQSAAVWNADQVREGEIGPAEIERMIEFHGRLATSCAIEIMRQLTVSARVVLKKPVSPEKVSCWRK